jgi:carbamoyltransferase
MLQVHKVNKKHLLPEDESYQNFTLNEKLYTIKSTIPAVTHVDYSARIQTVNQSEHPLFWKLINENRNKMIREAAPWGVPATFFGK